MKNSIRTLFPSVVQWFCSLPRSQRELSPTLRSRANPSRVEPALPALSAAEGSLSKGQGAGKAAHMTSPTENPPSLTPEQFRRMLEEALADPQTRRLLLQPLAGTVFSIQGGVCSVNPPDICPGAFTFTPSADNEIPLAAKGKSVSQTADLQQWQDSGGNVLAAVAKDGKVGIGTSTPQSKLTLFNAGPGNGLLLDGSTVDNSGGIMFKTPTNGYMTGIKAHGGVNALLIRSLGTAIHFQDSAGQIALMTILENGNVGIGTTIPSNKLHVEGNVQIGTPTAVRADMKALLFGTTATKQSRDDTAHGPEMITAAAQNAGPDDFRVVLWAGVQSHDNAMFLISTNGMLEWGPGGTGESSDQEFRLERNVAHQLSLIDATLVLARPSENNPTIALKYNGTNGGEIHLGPGGSNVLDTLISRPSTSVLNIGSVTGPAVLAVDGVNSRVGIGITSPNFVLHTSGAAVALGAPSSAPADANLNNSNISFYLDESSTPNKLKVRVKLSNGTLKTASIDLA